MYGFGSHEKDDEVAGSGNYYGFGDYGLDVRLGRRWRPDPLSSKYPGFSPYSVFFNNPISFVDVDGREPRLGQLANLSQIKGEMWKAFNANNVVTGTIGAKLQAMTNHFEANRLFTRDGQGKLVDVDASKNVKRYVYTTERGWIDMHHFFALADYTRQNGKTAAQMYAYNSERVQEWQDNPSGFSYEDIASDIAGIDFWLQYGDRLIKGDITLTNAVDEFFTNMGATDPSEAPNYEYIPHIVDKDYVLKSKEKHGLKGDDLKKAHKGIWDKRPTEMKEKINEAREVITD